MRPVVCLMCIGPGEATDAIVAVWTGTLFTLVAVGVHSKAIALTSNRMRFTRAKRRISRHKMTCMLLSLVEGGVGSRHGAPLGPDLA